MERSTWRRVLWTCLGIALPVSALGIVAACGGGGTAAPPALGEGSDASMDVKEEPEAAPMEAAPPPPMDGGCVDGASAITVTPTTLTFSAGDGGAGYVPCGSAAAAQSVTLTNGTCSAFMYTTSVSMGGNGATNFTVTPAMGMVPAGSSQVINVLPATIQSSGTVDLGTNHFGGVLTITPAMSGASVPPVTLNMTAQGVILSTMTQSIDFGGVAIGETAANTVSFTNNGNVATELEVSTGTSTFSVMAALPDGGATPPPLFIDVKKSAGADITFTPTMVQQYTDTLSLSVPTGTPLCAPLPTNIALKGQGTTGVSVQPTDIKFGNVQCNQSPAVPVTVHISNTGAAAQFTPTLGLGTNSPYTLQDSSGNTLTLGNAYPLPGASVVNISVVPKAVTSPAPTTNDGLADTLTITTTGPGDMPHNVSLHETAQGAVLTLSPSSISVSVKAGQTAFSNFTVGNTGNYPVSFTLTTSTNPPGTPGTFTSNLTSGTLSANDTSPGVLSAVGPPVGIQYTGWLTLQAGSGSILCQDVPAPMPLSVTGN